MGFSTIKPNDYFRNKEQKRYIRLDIYLLFHALTLSPYLILILI